MMYIVSGWVLDTLSKDETAFTVVISRDALCIMDVLSQLKGSDRLVDRDFLGNLFQTVFDHLGHAGWVQEFSCDLPLNFQVFVRVCLSLD
jgi:hypothetical protein